MLNLPFSFAYTEELILVYVTPILQVTHVVLNSILPFISISLLCIVVQGEQKGVTMERASLVAQMV